MDANYFREFLRIVHCWMDRPDVAEMEVNGEFSVRVPDGELRRFSFHAYKELENPLSYLDIYQVRPDKDAKRLLEFLDNESDCQ